MTDINNFAILLGKRIRTIREQMKLKRASFSRLVQVSEDAIGLIERGEKLPRLETLYKIAYNLNIPLVKLLDFEKEIKPHHIKHKHITPLNFYIKTELLQQIQKIQAVAQNILDKTNSYSSDKPSGKPKKS